MKNINITEDIEDMAYNVSMQLDEVESFVKIQISALENDHTVLDIFDINNTNLILLNAVTRLKDAYDNLMDNIGI